jgi:hypothetical protein
MFMIKQKIMTMTATAALALLTASGRAEVYTDATGDLHNGVPSGVNFAQWPFLDIASVEVTNNAVDLIFKIKVAGNPLAPTDWGKYLIGIDTNATTGDVSANGNGWGRSISMPNRGMDFWVGSWVDNAKGAQLSAYDGVGWTQISSSTPTTDTNSVTIRVPFALLGKGFGDTVDFDVYVSGGGTPDTAVDALNNPSVAGTDWGSPAYTNDSVLSSYTLKTVATVPHTVTFMVDMGVPIWEYDTAFDDGLATNLLDKVMVRGNFNNWGTPTAGELIQVSSTVFSNRFTFEFDPGETIFYKYTIDRIGQNAEYETPFLLGGANRSFALTNTVVTVPTACFADRCLTDPPVSTVKFEVDMTFQRQFGEFGAVTGETIDLRGDFDGWGAGLALGQGADPLTNIYSGELPPYYYYPTGSMAVGYYKFKLNSTGGARDGGWERAISTGGGNRSFSLASTNQVLSFKFNDEDGIFPIDKIEKPDADSAKLTFKAYYEGIYEIQARSVIGGTWGAVGTVTNKTKDYKDVSFTHTGLTGVPEQYYQAEFKGFDKPALP